MLRPGVTVCTADWVESNLNLSYDSTAAGDGFVKLRRFQRDIMNDYDNPLYNDFVHMAGERLGKSFTWKGFALCRAATDPVPIITVYPNDDESAATNQDTIEPLMKGIPILRDALARPKSKRKDKYQFPFLVWYFQGAGTPVVNKTACICIGDEVDFWPKMEGQGAKTKKNLAKTAKNVHNTMNLKKRSRTWASDRKNILCSSPRTKDDIIYVDFKRGSMSYDALKCQNSKCGKHIFSHAVGMFRWQEDQYNDIITASIRLKCPFCGTHHKESQAEKMTEEDGFFYHFRPNRLIRSHQMGALSRPDIWSWREIVAAVKSARDNPQDQDKVNYLYQTVRGLPSPPPKAIKNCSDREDVIMQHCAHIPETLADNLVTIWLSADSQRKSYIYTIRGLDNDGNSYLLGHGEVMGENESERHANFQEVWYNWRFGETDWCIVAGLIDTGCMDGRHAEIDNLIASTPGLIGYKGNSAAKYEFGKYFKESPNKENLIIAHPHEYKAMLLQKIYVEVDFSLSEREYWFLPQKIDRKYLQQIAAIQPTERKVEYINWQAPPSWDDHFFDAEKQHLVLMDYVTEAADPTAWPRQQLPKFVCERIQREG